MMEKFEFTLDLRDLRWEIVDEDTMRITTKGERIEWERMNHFLSDTFGKTLTDIEIDQIGDRIAEIIVTELAMSFLKQRVKV